MVHNSNTQNFKVAVLQPILDDWNKTIQEDWIIEPSKFDDCQVVIRSFNGRYDIHGILITRIASICNAYDWCWGLYARSVEDSTLGKIEIRIH